MKKLIFSTLALVALASCTKSSIELEAFELDEVRISSGIASRASGTLWADNDAISLFAYGNSAASLYAENKHHKTSTGGTSSTFAPVASSDYIYYPTEGSIDLYAIYPYATATTFSAYAIDVLTDQSTHSLIDLMYAKKSGVLKGSDAVEMTFDHMLSQIEVTLTAASDGGFSTSDLAAVSVTVGGTKVAGSFSAESGAISLSGDATDLTLSAASNVATFIVIPQTATPVFTITVDGADYKVTGSSLTMASSNKYSYTISVSKTAAIIKGSTINPWTSNSQGNFDATPVLPSDIELVEGVYNINTAVGLQSFASMVNSNSDTDATFNATLLSDIDLGGAEWTPIGSDTTPYKGTFDGGDNTIYGLYINTTSDYQGLFGYVDGGSISNVTIKEPDVAAYGYVGAACGYATSSSTIENCGVEGGSVSGTAITVAYNNYNDVYAYVGGVVGYASSVTKCYNTGSVSGTSTEDSTVRVGGVVGSTPYSSTISSCYNTGVVSGTAPDVCVGGIVGEISASSVTECYNMGAVSGISSTHNSVGGVVGYIYYTPVSLCYNAASVSSTSSSGNVGGVVGYNNISTITSCYWDSDYYAGSGVGVSYDGSNSTQGLTKTLMKGDADTDGTLLYYLTNAAYGNSSAWKADSSNINDGYPILSWQ